jgi:hypothetical protein
LPPSALDDVHPVPNLLRCGNGINVPPCSHADAFCLKFRGLNNEGNSFGALFLYQSDSAFFN